MRRMNLGLSEFLPNNQIEILGTKPDIMNEYDVSSFDTVLFGASIVNVCTSWSELPMPI